jgi:arylsulfatase A-like enzyme
MRHPEFGFAAPSAGRLNGEQPMRELLRLAPEMSEEEAQFLRDLYDEEVRYTDRGIGRLLDALDELDLRERTAVVLTSDHGEEFLDHGDLGHTSSLYEELIRVPLIVRQPERGAAGPAVVSRPVSLVSLAPTILGWVGLEYETAQFQGPSLQPLIDGGAPEAEVLLLSEVDFVPLRKGRSVGEVHKKAVIGERFKLIRHDRTGQLELYDLSADPEEQDDLGGRDTEQLSRLGEILERVLAKSRSGAVEPRPTPVSDAEIERLRNLGYIGD